MEQAKRRCRRHRGFQQQQQQQQQPQNFLPQGPYQYVPAAHTIHPPTLQSSGGMGYQQQQQHGGLPAQDTKAEMMQYAQGQQQQQQQGQEQRHHPQHLDDGLRPSNPEFPDAEEETEAYRSAVSKAQLTIPWHLQARIGKYSDPDYEEITMKRTQISYDDL
mmetsp:Transcript_20466/g.53287  ORF Transcript_20466/g.53287 Transcript_20466/m.53287 type:complete len:161 (-) Transcript_20466:194-676(-)